MSQLDLSYIPLPWELIWMKQMLKKGQVNTTDGGMADMWLSPLCSKPKTNPYVKQGLNPDKTSHYYNQYTLTEAGKAYLEANPCDI